jgi:hypothetical protein
MGKEMFEIVVRFKLLWGCILLHSSILVLNPHVLITKEGGLSHQPPLAFKDWWLGFIIRHIPKDEGWETYVT